MTYTIQDIARILKSPEQPDVAAPVVHLLLDSRKLIFPETTLFFALKGPRRNGHAYLPELYVRGVRYFVVSEPVLQADYPEAIFLTVPDTLQALQTLSSYHRKRFQLPVIGITGSNGKTIVKEWLFQLMEHRFRIIRSPKSYNSQIGVPLSVWMLQENHELAIWEAGISQSGEMDRLQKIIQPTLGIFTNIGEAHSEGFLNIRQKINEKLRLFTGVDALIYRKDDPEVHQAVAAFWQQARQSGRSLNLVDWSFVTEAALQVFTLYQDKDSGTTQVTAQWRNREVEIEIPFTDEASVENAIHCWCVLLHLEFPDADIQQHMLLLERVAMRLELNKGIHHCTLINDSYSNDLNSLKIALEFLAQQAHHEQRTVILSDFLQTSMPEKELYPEAAALLSQYQVHRFIGIGERWWAHQQVFPAGKVHRKSFFRTTEAFVKELHPVDFKEETILLKGARPFSFETIHRVLELQQHQTVLEVNLTSLAANLQKYQQLLQPGTRMMVMVKALAYGSGSVDVARILQYHKVDYLAVAYADEGVTLREGGIWLPILVMNPEPTAYENILQHNLEPALYSQHSIQNFVHYLSSQGLQQYPVHLELETGMHRLGLSVEEVENLCQTIKEGLVKVQSVFTHLVASEDPQEDEFTHLQVKRFKDAADRMEKILGYSFIRHVANTAAISRHPKYHLNMVRLGAGLYGFDSRIKELAQVSSLRTTVAQIRTVAKGETVSYNRRGKVLRDSRIATIRIGYADGYPRNLGNGAGEVVVKGQRAPIVGTICMDMTMIDVTDVPGVHEGDEVLLFGSELPLPELAAKAQTLPHEIISRIADRVKRIYIEE